MTEGRATLAQLQNAPAGTVFRERRLLPDGAQRNLGSTVRRREPEHRGTAGAEVQAWLDRLEALEAQTRELGLPQR